MSRPPKGPAKLIPKPVRLTAEEHGRTDLAAIKAGKTPATFRRDAVMQATSHALGDGMA